MTKIKLQNNWELEDAGGGQMVLRDINNGNTWTFSDTGDLDVDGSSLSDGATTVYNASTDTVGDGTTSANHSSVTTDALTIGDGTQINQIEHGTETDVTMPGASSDDTFANKSDITTSVSFGTAFGSTPDAYAQIQTLPSRGILVTIENVSTTGFDIRAGNYSSDDHSGKTEDIGWVAIS